MKYWLLICKSESGDDYGPWLFKNKLEGDALEAFLRKHAECEFVDEEDEKDEGPGEYGSYLHIESYNEIEVEDE